METFVPGIPDPTTSISHPKLVFLRKALSKIGWVQKTSFGVGEFGLQMGWDGSVWAENQSK